MGGVGLRSKSGVISCEREQWMNGEESFKDPTFRVHISLNEKLRLYADIPLATWKNLTGGRLVFEERGPLYYVIVHDQRNGKPCAGEVMVLETE